MLLERKEISAHSKSHLIEWQMCEDERDWQLKTAKEFENPTPTSTSTVQPHHWMILWTVRWVAPSLLILTVLGGWWIWYNAKMGLAQIETELQAAVAAEAWLPVQETTILNPSAPKSWQVEIPPEAEQLSTPAEPAASLIKMQVVDLGQEWAVVQVVVKPVGASMTYRQTRVYQQMSQEWTRIAPTSAHWGQSHQLETRYFRFHYFNQDAATVATVAEQLDTLYPTLYAAFFPEPPGDEKLVVQIGPEVSLRELSLQATSQDALVLVSPAVTLAPTELAMSDQLAQAMVLALLDKLANHATQRYNLPSRWRSLHHGLRLWLLWDQELPLSIWRQSVVRWVFWESSTEGVPEDAHFPEFAHDLCANYLLWMRSPIKVGIPVACLSQAGAEAKGVAWRYPYQPPLQIPLSLLLTPMRVLDAIGESQVIRPAESAATMVVLATVVEYAATTFGADRMPVLLAALPEHDRWETLIPAVFGISLAEFEAGLHAFLVERYGIMR